MYRNAFLGILCFAFLFSFCKPGEGSSADSKKALAKVFNKTLYLADVAEMVPDDASPEDSLLMVNALAQKWIRDNLMMHEAERNIPKDLNIDQLVNEYRASLILHSYEQRITEENVDSVISEKELKEFYEKNKEQYQLQTAIARCLFIRVAKPVPQPDSLRKWWYSRKKEDLPKMISYASRQADEFLLTDTVWYRIEDIASELPKGTLTQNNVSAGKEFVLSDDEFQYFFRALEVKSTKEIAPLAYIKGQATKFILHERKIKLLEDKKEELYQRESRRKNVKTMF